MKSLALAFALCASPVAAQLVSPTTAYALAWDYTGKVDHFELRYATSGTWTNVGTKQQIPAPALIVGAHTVQVRACVTKTSTNCPVTSLAFTVAAPKKTPPRCPNGSTGRQVTVIQVTVIVEGGSKVTGTLCDGT